MPTSTIRHLSNVPTYQLGQQRLYRPNDVLISPVSLQAIGSELSGIGLAGPASQTYPAANRAIAYPFQLGDYFLVRKVWWMNGTTATTNSADVAVYTEGGSRLVSGGGTAIATANVIQEVDVTDTLLPPGRYWCAYAQNGTTATPVMLTPSTAAGTTAAMGVAQMATAYVLPSTFTPAQVASNLIPFFGIASRTQVA